MYNGCVACGGRLETQIELCDSIQQVCSKCEGIHSTVSVQRYDEISKGMELINSAPDVRYFDIQGVDAEGKTVKRSHGWMNPKLGFSGIVQFG